MMNRNRRKWTLAATLLVSIGGLGCAEAQADKPVANASNNSATPMPKTDRITMAEFKKLVAANNVTIVDVRGNDAYIGGHIPGALSIPEETINEAVAEKLKKMGKPVATYCS